MTDNSITVKSYYKGVALISMASLFWSSAGLMIKTVSLPPIQIAMYRSLVAGLFLGIYLMIHRRHLSRDAFSGSALRTALFYMLTVTLFVLANKLTTSANAVFLQYTAPVYVILISYFAFREKVSLTEVATVAICLAGMFLFFMEEEKSSSFVGNVVGVLSGVAFALLQVSVKRAERSEAGSQDVVAMETKGVAHLALGNVVTVGMLFVFILVSVRLEPGSFLLPLTGSEFTMTAADAAGLLFLGIVQLGCGYLCFAKGARHISSVEIAIYTLLEPVLNPVWTFLGTGETPGGWAILGAVVIIVAMVVNAIGSRQR